MMPPLLLMAMVVARATADNNDGADTSIRRRRGQDSERRILGGLGRFLCWSTTSLVRASSEKRYAR